MAHGGSSAARPEGRFVHSGSCLSPLDAVCPQGPLPFLSASPPGDPVVSDLNGSLSLLSVQEALSPNTGPGFRVHVTPPLCLQEECCCPFVPVSQNQNVSHLHLFCDLGCPVCK